MPEDRIERQVLVVDDDRDAAMMFAALLQELGHAVEYVTNPRLVLDIARRLKPWLVFLDIGLPGLSGWELAPLIRRELGEDAVRIVAVSAAGASPSIAGAAAKRDSMRTCRSPSTSSFCAASSRR